MRCTNCSQEISTSAVLCPACGAAVPALNIPQAPPPPVAPVPAAPIRPAGGVPPVLAAILSVLCFVFLAGASYLKTKVWSHGNFNSEASGYFLGGLLGPVLIGGIIAWLIQRARKGAMSNATAMLVAFSIAFGLSLFSMGGTIASLRHFETPDQRMGHLLKQAAGQEPIPASDDEWYDGPAREYFRDMMNYGQEYRTAILEQDRSELPSLYSPESYASEARLEKTLSQLQALLDIDKKYESVEPILKKLEERAAAADASEREKTDFVKGLRETADKSAATRLETFQREEKWLQSTITLYEWMLDNFSSYRVKDHKVVFVATGLVDEFSAKQSESLDLRKATLETSQRFEDLRKSRATQLGLDPSSLPGQDRKP